VLSLPSEPGQCPAVAVVDGAGPASRDSGANPLLRAHLSSRGIGVLCWDKPGVGDSSGDWTEQSFEDRAYEALYAISFLQSHPAVDSTRVGLLGFSQGGWVAPLAASLSREVAFVVTVSGPGVDVGMQNAYDIANTLKVAGYPDDRVRELVDTLARLTVAARRNAPFDEVEPLLRDPRNGPLLEAFQVSEEMLGPMWGFMQRLVQYDPAPVLANVNCPVLAIFGADDKTVPVDESISAFERGMVKAGNSQLTVRIFPNANHGMMVDAVGTLAPGYLDLVARWVLDRQPGSPESPSLL